MVDKLDHSKNNLVQDKYRLEGKVVIITGGAGLLGIQHAKAIAEMGGVPVLLDVSKQKLLLAEEDIKKVSPNVYSLVVDITIEQELQTACEKIISEFEKIDVLINNAAINPKVEEETKTNFSRLENYSLDNWNKELNVGLTGAFLCSKIFGSSMAINNSGIIINISSDLGIIAPNQNLYRKDGVNADQQSVKPVSYSVIKHGLIGLTRYLATYWAEQGVRCNALALGGVFNQQDEQFVKKISELIPMRRMANLDEYKSAIVFLASDASSYMNGSVLTIDGGRSCW